MVNTDLPVITRSRLVSDLSSLGLVSGDTVMLHASVKAVGWIVGGPDMVLRAILDVIGSTGSLMMYIKCEEPLNELDDWPEDWKDAYLAECPPFDPYRTRANRVGAFLRSSCAPGPGCVAATIPRRELRLSGQRRNGLRQTIRCSSGMARVPLLKNCATLEGRNFCWDGCSIV